jgi:hypothetical protein
MSWEAWGDGDDGDGRFTEDRCAEIAFELFRRGAQQTREMMARFVEQGGDAATAASIRANWNPSWGDDPGQPTDTEYEDMRQKGFDLWAYAP